MITSVSGQHPLVLIQEGEHFRLFDTEARYDSGLEWDFVADQTVALNHIGSIITHLEQVQTELENGTTSSLPQFVDFDRITGIYNDQGDISRASDSADSLSVPIDLSDHLAGELAFWQAAYEATESGQYGFEPSRSYLTLDKEDGAVQAQIPDNAVAGQLTLEPASLNNEPEFSYTATAGTGLAYIWGGLAAVSLVMGAGAGLGSGISTGLNRYRRRKERNAPR